ncbi:hypothetical protein DB88DRAFT_97975 [Papiliotrema laurentii]|uniref:Uncharacterized protein n=1 Tax=Papiliotrema laurentii TaxID=5418 RepID=A0AAD9CSX7_PAPLA|nr:hypothetical protein DB88DRAFT_97975 [Papiliotrema laurentii]
MSTIPSRIRPPGCASGLHYSGHTCTRRARNCHSDDAPRRGCLDPLCLRRIVRPPPPPLSLFFVHNRRSRMILPTQGKGYEETCFLRVLLFHLTHVSMGSLWSQRSSTYAFLLYRPQRLAERPRATVEIARTNVSTSWQAQRGIAPPDEPGLCNRDTLISFSNEDIFSQEGSMIDMHSRTKATRPSHSVVLRRCRRGRRVGVLLVQARPVLQGNGKVETIARTSRHVIALRSNQGVSRSLC